MPARGTIPSFSIDDLCHTRPFAFKRVLYTATIERSTNHSISTNRYPIVEDILSFISVVEMVFNRLSNVRLLLGIVKDHRPVQVYGYTDNPYQEKYAIHYWNLI